MNGIIKTESDIIQIGGAENLINEFISECDVRPASKMTYRKGILNYFRWLVENKIELDSVTRKEVLQYKEWLRNDPDKISSATGNTYLMSVKKFYTWAEAIKKYPNVARDVKTEGGSKKFLKQHLTKEQCKFLLDYFKTNKRNYALINLLIRTGIRTIEAHRLDIGDITFKHGKRVLLVHGKGHLFKDAFVVLTDKSYFPIKEYLETRNDIKQESPIFVSTSNMNSGERISTQIISRIAKGGMKKIGLDSPCFTAHSLRHTCAVLMLKSGAKMERLQAVLRHKSISTTQIYTSSIEEELRIKDAPEELLDDII